MQAHLGISCVRIHLDKRQHVKRKRIKRDNSAVIDRGRHSLSAAISLSSPSLFAKDGCPHRSTNASTDSMELRQLVPDWTLEFRPNQVQPQENTNLQTSEAFPDLFYRGEDYDVFNIGTQNSAFDFCTTLDGPSDAHLLTKDSPLNKEIHRSRMEQPLNVKDKYSEEKRKVISKQTWCPFVVGVPFM